MPSFLATHICKGLSIGCFRNQRIEEVSKGALSIHSWLNFDLWVTKTQSSSPPRSRLHKKKIEVCMEVSYPQPLVLTLLGSLFPPGHLNGQHQSHHIQSLLTSTILPQQARKQQILSSCCSIRSTFHLWLRSAQPPGWTRSSTNSSWSRLRWDPPASPNGGVDPNISSPTSSGWSRRFLWPFATAALQFHISCTVGNSNLRHFCARFSISFKVLCRNQIPTAGLSRRRPSPADGQSTHPWSFQTRAQWSESCLNIPSWAGHKSQQRSYCTRWNGTSPSYMARTSYPQSLQLTAIARQLAGVTAPASC